MPSTYVWSDLMCVPVKREKMCFVPYLTLFLTPSCWFAIGPDSRGQELSKNVYNLSVAHFVAALEAFKSVSGSRFKGHLWGARADLSFHTDTCYSLGQDLSNDVFIVVLRQSLIFILLENYGPLRYTFLALSMGLTG